MMNNRISTGGDTDSYCTKCRLILEHIIVAIVGGAVVKVKCKTCGSIHRFRDPSVNRSGTSGPGRTPKPRGVHPSDVWETALKGAGGPEKPYDISASYKTGDLIVHPIFGKGIVQKTSFKKCSVLFRDGVKMLAAANT